LRVKELAERLDIAPAFASNLLNSLEKMGHVARVRGDSDQRVTLVTVTAKGKQILHRIDENVQVHVEYFARQLSQDAREAAISIMLFYIGMTLHVPARANGCRIKPGQSAR
jgi:DNA-binding MarR family transcriptional regulator